MEQKNSLPKVYLAGNIRVKDLAKVLNLPVTRIIRELMRNNIYVTINEEIDPETAAVIAEDLGYHVELGELPEAAAEKKPLVEKIKGVKVEFLPRSPVVVIMGHVDHGKTTLLDSIRKTDVAAQESGGITQSIGAYQIEYKGKLITFIDTPGHEAFEKMRERGAHLTDIAILVVAADDGVKPQTKEAIAHIHRAGIPVIVAANKIDKPEANINKVKQELAKEGVNIEEFGGDVPLQEVSAKTGQGVDHLLDTILLVAEMENLSAPVTGPALGTVIESHLSPQRGPEATILVQSGIFRTGDLVSSLEAEGKIRKMENDKGKEIREAQPSMPVQIIGFTQLPTVSSLIQTGAREEGTALHSLEKGKKKALLLMVQKARKPKVKRLNLIIKADTEGADEAVLENLAKLGSKDVVPYVIDAGVGEITESDVLRAHITGAKLLGFGAHGTAVAEKLAKQLGIQIHFYDLIYELIEAVRKALEDMLDEEEILREVGKLKVLAIFRTEKDKMIVGGKVTQGALEAGSTIRVKRGEQILGEGKLGELQSGKRKVSEVKAGQEAGLKFLGSTKIVINDALEFYKIEKKKITL